MMRKIFLILLTLLLAVNVIAAVNYVHVDYPNGGETLKGTIDINFSYSETQPFASQVLGNLYYSLVQNAEQPPLANPIILNYDLKTNCPDLDDNPSTIQYCSYKWHTTSAQDGLWFIVVTITDNLGNKRIDSSTAAFRIDNTAPTTTTSIENNKWYNSQPLNISFSCTDASNCRYTAYLIDNSTVGVAVRNGTLSDEEKAEITANLSTTIPSSNWLISNYPLTAKVSINGWHSLKFYSKDLAENIESTKSINFGLDTLNPLVEITLPTGNTYSNLIEFNVQKITNSDINGQSITVLINGSNSSVFSLNNCTNNNGNYYCSYNETSLVRGNTYTITVRARDMAGNVGEDSITFTYLNFPQQGPNNNGLTVSVIQPNGPLYIKGTYQIIVSVSENQNNSLYLVLAYSVNPNTFQNIIVNGIQLNSSNCNSTNFTQTTTCTFDWNTLTVQDGNYYIDALLFDAYGNSARDSSNKDFRVDNTLPVITTNAGNYATWQNQDFNVIFNVTDNSGITINEYSIDNSSWQVGSNIMITTDGNHFIQFKATDLAGNIARWQGYVLLDKIGPTMRNPQPPANSYTNDENTLITLEVFDNLSGLNLNSIYLTIMPPVSSMPMFGPQTFDISDEELSYDVNTRTLKLDLQLPLEEKTYIIFVYAEDNAGNDSNYSWQFTVDLEKPETIVDLTAELTIDNDVLLSWTTVTDTCIARYNIYRAEIPIISTNKNDYLIGYSTTSQALDTTAELGKTYYYRIAAVDCAGNESSLSNMVMISIPSLPRVISITPRYDTIYMQSNDSYAVSYEVENLTDENQTITIQATTNSAYLQAITSVESLNLNPKEKTTFTVTIQTRNAPLSSFVVTIKVITSKNTENAYLNVIVTENTPVSVIPLTNKICKNKKEAIQVQLRNNTDAPKTVYLRASNEMFLPYFAENEIELDAFEEKYVDLYVQTNRYTQPGEYSVKVYATVDSQLIVRDAIFNVEDCSTEMQATFKLTTNNACISAQKEKTTTFNITIENLLDEEQTIFLQTVSDIPTEIQQEITLEPKETLGLTFTVKPTITDTIGNHSIQVYAWNSKYKEEKLACARVIAKGSSTLELLSNNLVINKDSTTVIGIKITNNGDFDQEYTIELNNPSDFNVTLTDNEFKLEKGKSKTIYLSITTTKETPTGEYYIDVIMQDNERMLSERLYFTVKSTQEEQKKVVIAAYPENITMETGTQKVIDIIIINNTNETRQLKLSFESSNKNIKTQNISFTLKPNDKIILKAPIKTESNLKEGKYSVYIKVTEKNETLDEKTMTITIGKEKQEPSSNLMAGLAALASYATGEGALGMLLLTIIIVALIILFKRRNTSISQEKEKWASITRK